MNTFYGDRVKNNETNIYILAGVFSGVSAILLIVFVAILVSNSRLGVKVGQMIRDTPFSLRYPQNVQNDYGQLAPPPKHNQAVQFEQRRF